MSKYRKKPVIIEAFQLTYEQAMGFYPVPLWFIEAKDCEMVEIYVTEKLHGSQYCIINTLEGKMRADKDDYIIQGVNGELYPCKPEIFEKTYELVEN